MRLTASIGLFALLTTHAVFAEEKSVAVGATVTLENCPYAGTEGGCIMLNDNSGNVYNITSANPKPNLKKKMISLTGTVGNKSTICMQGTPLEDIKWSYTDKNCPAD